MKKLLAGVASWFESLPSPFRHAIMSLLVIELMVVAVAFAGVSTVQDIRLAAGGLVVSMVQAGARWLQQYLASLSTS